MMGNKCENVLHYSTNTIFNISYYQTCCIAITFFLSSCTSTSYISDLFKKSSPYDNYKNAIYAAKLESTALGNDWIQAGEDAINDSIKVTIPFRETIYFPSEKPNAISYRFKVKRGEKIVITIKKTSRLSTKVFIDLFEMGKYSSSLASADTGNVIEYKVKKDINLLLRVQLELLRSCQLILTIESKPSLLFPVQGKDSKSIISIFGDAREGGKRKHEGIDILAKKGTPVIASSNGFISNVSINAKGGKVVFLTSAEMEKSLYYAHLDTQIVSVGQVINEGDTIGLVGNTGNAKYTVSHLHFGIYDFIDGAIDPYPFVYQTKEKLPALITNNEKINQWARAKENTILKLSPHKKELSSINLPKNTLCKIIGGQDGWMHVRLPNGNHGYVPENKLEPVENAFENLQLKQTVALYDETYTNAAIIDSLNAGNKVPIHAKFDQFLYTKSKNGLGGWIAIP